MDQLTRILFVVLRTAGEPVLPASLLTHRDAGHHSNVRQVAPVGHQRRRRDACSVGGRRASC
jgi:hypothetical protein